MIPCRVRIYHNNDGPPEHEWVDGWLVATHQIGTGAKAIVGIQCKDEEGGLELRETSLYEVRLKRIRIPLFDKEPE